MIVFSERELDKAADLLKKGFLVAFPTETVYGLGAPIFEETTVAKIFQAKGRPSDNPLIAHISSLNQVGQIAIDIPQDFYKLVEAFFPGPLTVVLRKHPNVPDVVSAGLNTIGIRMPAHKTARALIDLVGQPLVAPSANLSGKPSATTAQHVRDDFEGKIAAVIDGGPCNIGVESTVINITESEPILLRPGLFTKLEIERCLGKSVRDKKKGDAIASPGMKYRHYAPKASIKLFKDRLSLIQYKSGLKSQNYRILSNISLESVPVHKLSKQTLYSELRASDASDCGEILIFCDEVSLNDQALMNRLLHAASKTDIGTMFS